MKYYFWGRYDVTNGLIYWHVTYTNFRSWKDSIFYVKVHLVALTAAIVLYCEIAICR